MATTPVVPAPAGASRTTPSWAQNLSDWAPWIIIVGLGVLAAVVRTDQFMVGLIVGSLYALAAVGLTMIYGIAKVAHFAHGDVMMFSAYLTFFALTGSILGASTGDATLPFSLSMLPGATERIWEFSFGYGFILAIIVGVLVMIPILLGIDRIVYQRLARMGAGTAIIAVASLGVAITLRGAMLVIWGPTSRRYSTGIRSTVDIPGLPKIVADQFFIFAMVVLLTIAAYLIMFKTTLGTSMRATADNPDLARASGISTASTRRWTWIIGGGLTAVAGILLALQSQLTPELGFVLLLPIFASMILGGIGNPIGAFIGGLIVGIVAEVSVSIGIIAPGYKIGVAFVVLIIVILFRPQGLFGARQ